jgi:hypothetical protein
MNIMKRFGKIPLKGVPKEALTQDGFQLPPSKVTGDDFSRGALLEKEAIIDPRTQKIPADLQKKNLERLQEKISGASTTRGGQTIEALNPSSRGIGIENKAEEVGIQAGKKFSDIERQVIKPIQKESLPTEVVGQKTISIDPMTNKKELQDIIKTNITKKMDGLKNELGFDDPSRGLGNLKVKKNTAKKISEYSEDLSGAKTLESLIDTKRNIQDEIFEGLSQGTYGQTRDKIAMKKVYGKINESIEETVSKVLPDEFSKDAVNLWKQMNREFSEAAGIMKSPSKRLSLEKDIASSDIPRKIQKLKVENINKLKEVSKTNPDVKAFYDELSRGAFEDIMRTAKGKEDIISPKKFQSAWRDYDKGVKEALFEPEFIKDMNSLDEISELIKGGDIASVNPSKTTIARIIFETGKRAIRPDRLILDGLKYMSVKHYYNTGKLYRQSAVNIMIKGSKKGAEVLGNKEVNAILNAENLSNYLKSQLRTKEE